MISDFNYFNQPEQPILTLCNPDDTELGVITNAEDVSLSIRFNDISDLSYKIYQSDDEDYNDRVYNKHIERRQVNVAGVGYFIITGVSEVEDDDGIYKNIQAKSCEYELNNIAAPYINGTYCLYKPENFDADSNEQIAQRDDEYLNKNCVLYEVMKVIPAWRLEQIKFVEGEQKYTDLASTFRTFESSDTTVYSFFKSEIQKNYNCFVEFDIEHRIVRVLHYDDVFIEEPVILSRANVLNSCEVSTTIDNYVNTFNVEGQDGVSIASCNPMGNTLIYNFDHDINTGLIDGVLKDALIYWKENLITNPNFSLNDSQWILLPEFVSEWESFNSSLLKVQEGILESVSLFKDSGVTESEFRELVYNSIFPITEDGSEADSDIIANLKESLSWWYLHDYVSDESKSSFTAYGIESDLLTALKTLLKPDLATIAEDDYYLFGITTSDDVAVLSDENYAKNIEAFFNQSAVEAKACYMKDLASYGITYADTFSSLEEYNKLLLCAQSSLESISSETDKINSYIDGYQAQLASISTTQVEENANPEALNKQQSLLEEYINNSNKALEIYENIKLELNSTVETIQTGISSIYNHNGFEESFERFLSENTEHTITASELYANLTRYFKQQTYTNDTIVITDAMGDAEKYAQERDLYNESVDLLKELSIPAYEVSIGAESFMMTPVFKDVLNGMNIKSAFYVELPNNDVPLFHLLEININYEEKSCEFKLGNRLNISNPAAILSELQATASSAASIVAAERINWGIREEKINLLMEAKSADIDTTFRAMKNSLNNTTIGADGLRCYALDENGNPSYGFWGANGALMFTDENNKPKMAIGRILRNDGEKDYYEYGLYGQSIIANTITADKLVAGTLSRGSNYIRNGSFETGYIPVKGTNYIKNGSFEQYTVSDMYGTVLTEWMSNITPGYRFVEDIPIGNNVPLGEHYYTARCADFDNNGIIVSDYISNASQVIEPNLTPGTYTLSFYHREKSNNSGTNPTINLYNSDGLIVSLTPGDSDIEVNCNGTTWKRCYISFETNEELTGVEINLSCDEHHYVDGVLLEKSNTLNDYSDFLGVSPVDADFWSPGVNSISLYEMPTPIGSKCFSILTYRDGLISQNISGAMGNGAYTLSFYYSVNDSSERPYVHIYQSNSAIPLISCGYNDNKESIEIDGVMWYRCHKTVTLESPVANPVVTIHCPVGVYIDGVMLEKSAVLNEYSNYLTETYARYTTVDDNGITVYNGKIKILDNNGVTVFGADDNGDLYIKGNINASSGEIGGWTISKDGLYRDNSGMSTNGEIIFYAGEEIISETEARYNFRVNRQGLLYATNATIGESLTLETYGNGNTNDGLYRVTLTGSSMIMQNKYSNRMSGIFFAGDVNGETITESSNNANLALMGYKQILFGNYSSSKWNHICTMGTDGDTLYFCPAKTSKSESDAIEAYLGTEERPWTSLYMKSVLLKKTVKMEPVLAVVSVAGVLMSAYIPMSVIKD